MTPDLSTTYRFGAFSLDIPERLLTRHGTVIPVPPKVFDTLAILVQTEGRLIRRNELIARLWPDSFVEDATLARNISDLRKILGESPSEQKFIETVPRIGYRFVAPVEQVTNDAPEPETPPEPEIAIVLRPKSNRRWLALGSCAAAVVLLGGLLSWRFFAPAKARVAGVRTLAVLPFLNFDQSSGNSPLGQELADALITRIATSNLVVRPTSSVLTYSSRQRDPIAAGRQLRVDAVLDGSIQNQGNVKRITMRLLRVRDGRSLWAGTFDAPEENIFALEDAISQNVAAVLSPAPAATPKQFAAAPDSENQTAKFAYYSGRYWFAKRTRESLLRSIACYRQALAADPRYARAYSGLAESYLLLSGYGFESQDDDIPLAREAAQQALALDPNLGEAHNDLALIAEDYQLDWKKASAEYREAIELSPTYPTAHHWYGEFLAYMGHYREGRAELQRAEDLDPTSLVIAADYAETFLLERKTDVAIQLLQKIVDLDPNFVRAHLWLAIGYTMQRRFPQALHEVAQCERIEPGRDAMITRGIIAAESGQRAEALEVVAQLAKDGPSSYGIGAIFSVLGDRSRAILWLNRAVDQRQIGIVNLKEGYAFDPLRSDARFQKLLARLNFPS